jgi:hypothetical protein
MRGVLGRYGAWATAMASAGPRSTLSELVRRRGAPAVPRLRAAMCWRVPGVGLGPHRGPCVECAHVAAHCAPA